MPLLDAMMAFALTMLAVATAVTMILHGLDAMAKARHKVLVDFLKQYAEKDINPVVEKAIAQLRDKGETNAARALDEATKDLVAQITTRMHLPDQNGAETNLAETRDLVRISTDEMLSRLKSSAFGRELSTALQKEADAVFDTLAQRFEALGQVYSEKFRSKARLTGTIVGLFLAFALNIDSIHMLSVYMTDQGARDRVIAEQEAVLAGYQDSIAQQPETVDLDTLRKEIAAARDSVRALSLNGFPMGWALFPNCPPVSSDGRCHLLWQVRAATTATTTTDGPAPPLSYSDREAINLSWRLYGGQWSWLVMWLTGCLLTGFLAGLGAPFWYDAVSSIANLTRKARGKPRTSTQTN